MKVLITGGSGYIGSHTCLELLRRGHDIFAIDNLCNGKLEALGRVKRLVDREFSFTQCDIRDRELLSRVFSEFKPDAVIHFAGLKSVSESLLQPSKYYDVNVGGTAILLETMEKQNCQNIVFSSSATVYGDPIYVPCDELHPLKPINPYGRSKLMGEQLIQDWALAGNNRHAVSLRYFNPAGADFSGEIGEDPTGAPSNLMPIVVEAAAGQRDFVNVFGDDYQTNDGTGIRDYIHVADLAAAHVASLEMIENLPSFDAINIGTGYGFSVLEILSEFSEQSGVEIAHKISARRVGDAPAVWADTSKAFERIGFRAKRGISDMCRDAWRWKQRNPNGYDEK